MVAVVITGIRFTAMAFGEFNHEISQLLSSEKPSRVVHFHWLTLHFFLVGRFLVARLFISVLSNFVKSGLFYMSREKDVFPVSLVEILTPKPPLFST